MFSMSQNEKGLFVRKNCMMALHLPQGSVQTSRPDVERVRYSRNKVL
jgi:hypothetical protein